MRQASLLSALGGAAAALAVALAGCTAAPQGAKPEAAAIGAAGIAGVYEGMLPCADCAGIRTALYLRASGTYTRVSHYLGTDGAFDEGGSWTVEEGRIRFEAAAPGAGPWFALPIEKGLRLLNREAKPVEGPLEPMYDLMRP